MQDQFSRDIFGDAYVGIGDPHLSAGEHRLMDGQSNASNGGVAHAQDFITDFITDPLAEFDDITRVGDAPSAKHGSPQVTPGFHASRYEKKPTVQFGGLPASAKSDEHRFPGFANGPGHPAIARDAGGVAPESVFGQSTANEPRRSILSAQLAQHPYQLSENWATTSIAPSQMWAPNTPKSGLSEMLSNSDIPHPQSAPVSATAMSATSHNSGILDPEILGTPTLPGSFESNFIVNANAMTPVDEAFLNSNYSSYSDRPMSPSSSAPFPRSESVSSFSGLNARPIDIVRSRRPSAQAGIAKSAGSRPHSRAGSVADLGRAATPTAAKRASVSGDAQSLQCTNCHTRKTPLWRRNPEGEPLCNACGLFLKLHGETRPMRLKTDVIKKRNRSKRNNKQAQGQDTPQDSQAQSQGQAQKPSLSQNNGSLHKAPSQQTPLAPGRPAQEELNAQAATTPSQSSISPYVSSPDEWVSPGVNAWDMKSPRHDAPLTMHAHSTSSSVSAADDDKWNWLKMK